MGLDFDAQEYCKNIKQTQPNPPFACPVDKCDKSYKSVVGLQYHLINYDHDNPQQPTTPIAAPNKKRGRNRVQASPQTPKDTAIAPKEGVIFLESENCVQYNIDDKSIKVSVDEPLPIITDEEFENLMATGCIIATPDIVEPIVKLPDATFKKIENYSISDAPPRSNAYIRFIEKSAEELDGEVEYDVDEEDTTWLAMINEEREESNLNPVHIDTLELLMDRLEKESYFQAAANGTPGIEVDDDAVCCICMDGECQNTNVILFCDMCNLAVHQDCYGVPYIPEGQWLCRRCLQSPSTPVRCVLCPNTGGAFKQTDSGMWAHVVCALWIPEVRFANTVFLEPIDSIETIPQARWRLTCYVCKEKGIGACIQCQRNSCYAAFHVTCAQQAGLYMHMDTVKDGSNEAVPVTVQKYAYCHAHTPPDAKLKENEEEDTRHKMKEARKVLAKKRSSAPVVLIPTIPPDRIQEISSLVTMQKKSQFIEKLIAYWTLKRQYRNGVPLLRRLQSQGQSHSLARNGIEGSPNTAELYKQLKYWQCLRQDLERARLLCELVRKREKLKAQYVKICEQVVMLQINPLETAMRKILETLESKDTSDIFREPVDTDEVPDYLDIVQEPMDLGTMRQKLYNGQYTSLDQMESDFDLMVKNCLAYNNKDTVFYRAGIRMRDQGGPLFQSTREELQREGIVDTIKSDDCVAIEVEEELKVLLKATPTEDVIQKMLILADKSQVLKNPQHRTKKIKQIRAEIVRMRKAMAKAKVALRNSLGANHTREDCEEMMDEDEPELEGAKGQTPLQTPPSSPLKSVTNSASPAGVNRRTAVLFTRKAQAAMKRPEISSLKEESNDLPMMIDGIKSPKRSIKNKRLSNDRLRSMSISPAKITAPRDNMLLENMPDSFRVYRANVTGDNSESDESDLSDISGSPCSSCSGFGISGSGSEYDSSSEEDDEDEEMASVNESESNSHSHTNHHHHLPLNDSLPPSKNSSLLRRIPTPVPQAPIEPVKPPLEPLQLVWAKCRGYPWYPALILDPKTPKGFVYNGVPLPAPPAEVLALRKNHTEEVFLVLFFDAKRTWQWLPEVKLEILGIDKQLDQNKLVESRKPAERKAVKKAYQDALHYQSQVSDLDGQGPDPIIKIF
ncbi:bromodomain-containing protein homolog [Episyrphus balteatus]|uniref:bromodomain-containing protein homolog n=1 Tax=Episyrphus balteatus TaxID=286459 RepID=UPI002485E153|nr:bromodomain-containing protein homolog [Episyrphus balteatus]